MKILKMVVTLLLCFVLAALTRIALHKAAPGVYGLIWGQPPAPTQAPQLSPSASSVTEPKPSPESTQPHLDVTGILLKGRHAVVVMSDGTVRTEQDNTEPDKPRLSYLTRTFVEWDGKRYWVKPKVPPVEKPPGTITNPTQNTAKKVLTEPDKPPTVAGS